MSSADLKFKTKTINWCDPDGNFHMNNILLQNKNGPCFIISFVNTLILSLELQDSNSWSTVSKSKKSHSISSQLNQAGKFKLSTSDLTSLKELLVHKEVSFNSILNELTTLMLLMNENGSELFDIGEILNILPHLSSGLNVNLKLNNQIIDDFEEQTESINQLLNMFDLKIIHGFVLSDTGTALYDDGLDTFDKFQDYLISVIDLFQRKYNINLQTCSEEELSSVDLIDPEDKSKLTKYFQLENFLNDNKTQLTEVGLKNLQNNDSVMPDNSFLIFFRNDHFNAIYKVKNQLYLLANDEGYRNNSEIVWEELKSIGGRDDELLNGFFDLPKLNETNPKSGSALETVNRDSGDVQEKEAINYADYDFQPENDVNLDDPFDPFQNEMSDVMLAKQLQAQEDEDYAKNLQKSYQVKERKLRESESQSGAVKKKGKGKNKSKAKPNDMDDLSKGKTATSENEKNCVIV